MDIKRGPVEVALSTDLRGAPYAFSLWDIHTGAQLVVFKGNKNSPIANCLQLINSGHFITATDNLLQIWSIYNRKCQDQKLFLPGRPSSLCVSPCGKYVVAGISEMIYVWQFSSGNLLAHTQRHYQTVTVLRMNHKGTYLFSGGEDGMVLVWPFADLISGIHNTGALCQSKSRTDIGVNEPKFTWQHHSAGVTDIHVSNSDCDICISTSTDKTVNIYSFSDGRRLHCIDDFPTQIWCAVMDRNCNRMFLGGQDGKIYEHSVSSLGLTLIKSRDADEEITRRPKFKGHKDRVDRLLLSLDGSLLISGSHDSTCKVWDIPTAKMVRDVKHQAPLANLTSFLVPDAFSLTTMTQTIHKQPYLVKPLKRSLYKIPRDTVVTKGDLFEESTTTIVMRRKQNIPSSSLHTMLPVESTTSLIRNHTLNQSARNTKMDIKDESIGDGNFDNAIKTRLRELYLLSVRKVFKDAAIESLKPYKDLLNKIDEKNTSMETRKDRLVKKQGKRKAITLDDEKTQAQSSPAKKISNPKTNGVKKIKSVDDIFV